jgi:hypothetical protein
VLCAYALSCRNFQRIVFEDVQVQEYNAGKQNLKGKMKETFTMGGWLLLLFEIILVICQNRSVSPIYLPSIDF